MRVIGSLIALVFAFSISVSAQKYKCIPAEFGLEEATVGRGSATLQQALQTIKARCDHGKLQDRHRKTIKIVRQPGCWGNPPADQQEILERYRSEVARLRSRYVVIEISCGTDRNDIRKAA